jgi:hypothetical protein
MHRAVDDVARPIDSAARRVVNDLAVERHFDERRCTDLAPEQAERIDQKMVLGTGHARRDVRID